MDEMRWLFTRDHARSRGFTGPTEFCTACQRRLFQKSRSATLLVDCEDDLPGIALVPGAGHQHLAVLEAHRPSARNAMALMGASWFCAYSREKACIAPCEFCTRSQPVVIDLPAAVATVITVW
jgi:hypothetical protein